LAVSTVAFSADGGLVAAGGADKSLTIWNAADSKEVKKIANLSAPVHSVAFAPAGATPMPQIVAGLGDHTIRLYDVNQGMEVKNLQGHTGAVNVVAYTPKGDQVISGSADGSVQVWSVIDGMAKIKLDYGSAVTSFTLTKDGARVAVGGVGKV